MKKATCDTRIRITIKMPTAGEQTLTMTACAWNELACAMSSAGYYSQRNGCQSLAKSYWDVADRIHRVLEAHKYFD